MAYRRIAYAALLGGAVLFQIVFRFYLSTFTLALVLLLVLAGGIGLSLWLSGGEPASLLASKAFAKSGEILKTPVMGFAPEADYLEAAADNTLVYVDVSWRELEPSEGVFAFEAIEKAKTADAFVFGTPVHYASASGNMTSFMDRLAYAGGKYLAYKPAAICASARRAGTTTTLDQLVKYPEFFHMPLVSGSYWPMVHGSKPEQVLEDEEGCAVMRELGRNMAWLLKCIELGKANGITHPENPRRPMTNFIR